jgi:hypothetical protein
MTPHHVRVVLLVLVLGMPAPGRGQSWTFADVTSQAGASYTHGYTNPQPLGKQAFAGGVAAGDYDNDGWVDLYIVRGDIGPNVLLRNRQDGTFEDVAAAAGVGLTGTKGCGPFFADLNGDGWLDLFIGGIEGTFPRLFFNRADGTFEDVTAFSGVGVRLDTYSAAASDYDRDGDLDLFMAHWGAPGMFCGRLWRNNGAGVFSCVDVQAGVAAAILDFSFTPNFADINGDRWPDILLASDYEQTQVFLNDRDGTFSDVTSPVFTDENGMGATVGDYDNDGDLDWFVSSIWQEGGGGGGWGSTGNRLYRNTGGGGFEDATDEAGVRVGYWGWGASFADFDNDGWLDLYHVNGWTDTDEPFTQDSSRLFISNRDGTFAERSVELGASYLGQGRGVTCFDYDRDGDLDIFVASAGEPTLLLRNDGGNTLNYLAVKLRGENPNAEAVGARVYATIGGTRQMRELAAGSNFESQNPVEAHFGLGAATSVDTLRIEWPDSAVTVLTNVAANQLLTIEYPQPPAPTIAFTDVTVAAGVAYSHGYTNPAMTAAEAIAGGVAAGDYNNDGWIDLYLVRGDAGPNALLRNNQDGTFENMSGIAGVRLMTTKGAGPFFADFNGDGWQDLFVGGIEGTYPTLFFNKKDGTFEDVTIASGLDVRADTYSAAAGDYDRDGDIDLLLAHWAQYIICGRLWENQGDGTFVCVDVEAGVAATDVDLSFTPAFADINNDRWPDILLASDFNMSQVFLNNTDGTFTDVTTPIISDENGMGSAVGDYDNDGDLDWFVSSIWQSGDTAPGWGVTGNRLYRNLGDGSFEDATAEAGVRAGYWGWGASFADFNNDGWLDLYHVNGWPFDLPVPYFLQDRAPLFMSNGDRTFTEQSVELGAVHLGQGRGIVCFDYDRDGDIDIFVASTGEQTLLLRNDGGDTLSHLTVKLQGSKPNTEAVGARVYVTAGGTRQMRELAAGSNFESQNPVEAHFGLGAATIVDTVRIEWPDTAVTVLTGVPVNQRLTVDYPTPPAPPPPPPLDYALRIIDASPNPFASETTLRLMFPGATAGAIRIYDVQGRLIRTLPIEALGRGPVSANWNGRDSAGNPVASGIYLVRMETSRGASAAKRVVVIR